MKINFEQLNIVFNEKEENKNIKLSFMGDWAPSSGKTSQIIVQKKETYYADIKEAFINSDLNIVNLETVIGIPNNTERFGRQFIDTKETLSTLKYSNINVACLANNHILDYGLNGLLQTQEALKNLDIEYIGAGVEKAEVYAPYLYEKDGVKIALINVADGELSNEKYNEGIGSADIDSYHVIDTIRKYNELGYMVILSIHAGIEFLPVPAPFIQKLYRNFVDEGASLIIGHHPHVVQGVEVYKNIPIFYSIGHFSIFRKDSRKQEQIGIIPQVFINKEGISTIEIFPFVINKSSLTKLNGEQLKNFVLEFKQLSELLLDKSSLDEICKAYVDERNMFVDFKTVSSMYKTDFNQAKMMINSMIGTMNYRYLVLNLVRSRKIDNKYNQLFKNYKLIRKIKFSDRIYLKQKNLFSVFNYMNKKLYTFLRYLKKAIFR